MITDNQRKFVNMFL